MLSCQQIMHFGAVKVLRLAQGGVQQEEFHVASCV